MKIRTIGWIALLIVIGSMLAAQPALAQIPCGPTINPSPTLSVNWPQFHFDAAHSGCNPYESVLSPDTVGNLMLDWTYLLNDYVEGNCPSSPAVANGVVYTGSGDYNVYALNAATGAEVWRFTTGNFVDSTPAVVNGVVYVGSSVNDFNLYALDAATGAKLWSYTAGGPLASSPTVANGVVYVAASYPDYSVYALNAVTGAKLWSYSTGSEVVESSPAVANGVVYIGSSDGNVYALNAATGAKLWSSTAGLYVYSSSAVANGVVYVGGGYSLYAFHLPGH